jgi:hypothetical protein
LRKNIALQQSYFPYRENDFRHSSACEVATSHALEHILREHQGRGTEKTTFPNEKVTFPLGKTLILY